MNGNAVRTQPTHTHKHKQPCKVLSIPKVQFRWAMEGEDGQRQTPSGQRFKCKMYFMYADSGAIIRAGIEFEYYPLRCRCSVCARCPAPWLAYRWAGGHWMAGTMHQNLSAWATQPGCDQTLEFLCSDICEPNANATNTHEIEQERGIFFHFVTYFMQCQKRKLFLCMYLPPVCHSLNTARFACESYWLKPKVTTSWGWRQRTVVRNKICRRYFAVATFKL